MSFDIADYIDREQHEVFAKEIDARIDELRDLREEWESNGDSAPDDEREELNALLAFRADVEQATGEDFDMATIIPEQSFTEAIRYYVEENDIDPDLSQYVDWERLAADRRIDYQGVDLDGETVWVR